MADKDWVQLDPSERPSVPRVSLSSSKAAPLKFNPGACQVLGLEAGAPVQVFFNKKALQIKIVPCAVDAPGVIALRRVSKKSDALYLGLNVLLAKNDLVVLETCPVLWDVVEDGIVLSLPADAVVAKS